MIETARISIAGHRGLVGSAIHRQFACAVRFPAVSRNEAQRSPMNHARRISVVGLGYVGLPVAVAFGRTARAADILYTDRTEDLVTRALNGKLLPDLGGTA